jgi:hypothetical protein
VIPAYRLHDVLHPLFVDNSGDRDYIVGQQRRDTPSQGDLPVWGRNGFDGDKEALVAYRVPLTRKTGGS